MSDTTEVELSKDLLRGAVEIAKFLGIKPRSVFYYVERGRLPVFRFKSQILARKSKLQKWIEQEENRSVGRCSPDEDM
jgi:Helix-turn-helix domain